MNRKPKKELTAEQRTERLLKKQEAIFKRMRESGMSILNPKKIVSVNGTDVGRHLKAMKEQMPQEATVTVLRQKGTK